MTEAAEEIVPQVEKPENNIFHREFTDIALERLYQRYSVKQKHSGLLCFILTAILYDVYILITQAQKQNLLFHLAIPFFISFVVLFVVCHSNIAKLHLTAFTVVSWVTAIIQLLFHVVIVSYKPVEIYMVYDTHAEMLLFGWMILFNYLAFVTLPLRLRYCVLLAVTSSICFVIMTVVESLFKASRIQAANDSTNEEAVGAADTISFNQYIAYCVLLLTSSLLGLMSNFLEDMQQRRAFLETRQSLQVKLVIEEQSAEQERLLLSVLPEHVAVRMRQDLGSTDSQFKKIYMSRHENVSILYADIVGFTAISSTYSAQDLVKILNELFARFDRLAEKYQQLRIKILGDCYYCISGAPRERPDHAVLCVHMGLSMVKAIKYVQQTTNSPVDMRVGIHTGAILAGVLGQRQWQFDVYSKDVELANKMESSGKAGRVHISEKTLSFLDGEFEVEPAFGEKREESLRMAGIKTFFIVSVLKPYAPSNPEAVNGNAVTDSEETILADGPSDTKEDESKCTTPNDEEKALGAGRAREDSEDFKRRLRKELVSRDGHKELKKHTNFLLNFRGSAETETLYSNHRDALTALPVIGCPIVIILTTVAHLTVLEVPFLHLVSTGVCTLALLFLALISVAEILANIFPQCLISCSKFVNDMPNLRKIVAMLLIFLLGSCNSFNLVLCTLICYADGYIDVNCTKPVDELISTMSCPFPSYYFSYTCVTILLATVMMMQLSHLVKTALMVLLTTVHCIFINTSPYWGIKPNITAFYNSTEFCFDEDDPNIESIIHMEKYTVTILLVCITIALAYLARHMEQVSRVLFLWKMEVEHQRDCVTDMRRRNEALVYNVLPPHVAIHFMGNRKRQHDELYSQSYAEVGVLFASMPNFTDFYSEETVNNQGLECLRFLNEVISDFDALLELPQFQDIIKIKTIGSTYMAASGLNQCRNIQPDDSVVVRWSHLSLLVEFALELMNALRGINEQSFNHFVLKMGVNHGPITAGVIGARKPHYDIWGNTVNVASRMESTGKAGAIQVTEETCEILQNFGYTFEQRGLVAVKGKGQLMTYYLQGRTPNKMPANPTTTGTGMSTLEEVNEEEENENNAAKTQNANHVIGNEDETFGNEAASLLKGDDSIT